MTLTRRGFVATGVFLTANTMLNGCQESVTEPMPELPFDVTVNLAGAEFGMQQPGYSNENPGKLHQDYTFNSLATVRYFAERGIRTFRVPIAWERLQPNLRQDLNKEYLSNILLLLTWLEECDATAIIDLHNYCRYRIAHRKKVVEAVMDETYDGKVLVSTADLCDLWRRLATALSPRESVACFGIMNEPHDLGSLDWKAASNSVVDAIRQVDQQKWIAVCGRSWASAARFQSANGNKPWISDVANKTVYEAHAYFDSDQSGKYRLSYDEELKRDPKLAQRPIQVLSPFVQWCQENKVPGYLGEIGVPNTDPRWLELVASASKQLHEAHLAAGYWAAGEWWNDYPLSVQPSDFASMLSPPLETMLRQMAG
ncbi:glycoside hydrolase family 5 protein [Bremerella sp. T1]|uniref:glycoside hydrolase family 5 protein n=1 Tax=Bremerella sp. TYQ1 TaxID=3119568 RepID=UPI001CC8FF87|nr:cellulase family glycosylhydrolase [Bremerella volcania]UBM33827.1 glycoside hydrolase family 5 protein [Bremerella volcania]